MILISPLEDRRRVMVHASDLGMTQGEYVFYTMDMLPDENVIDAKDVFLGTDGRNVAAQQAFECVFHVSK